ncbi:hypothetical protein N2152v2_001272 [Parachlorella kessleri]
MDELDELIDFLSDKRPQIKLHAVELVQGLTGSPEGIAHLSGRSATLLPALFRLVGDEQASRGAMVSLVNLSQEPSVQQQLLSLSAPSRCMDYIRERTCPHNDLLVMLLANLTSLEEGAAALLQLGKGALEGLHLAMLLKLFLGPVLPGQPDPYAHVATILPNVTRFREGRRLLLQPGRGLLPALASQLRSRDELRRRGCAGAIKNCCFSCEEDGTLEQILGEEAALDDVLQVLCGTGSRPDDTSSSSPAGSTSAALPAAGDNSDAAVREALAEAVLCLTRTQPGRKKLWQLQAPVLLQKGYEYEEHPGIMAVMEATAEIFLEDGLAPGAGGDGDASGEQQQGQQGNGRLVQIDELD